MYISELMINSQRFEKYRYSQSYNSKLISSKNVWRTQALKYRVPDNGYDMFYTEVI
jgi:hypothetical protein